MSMPEMSSATIRTTTRTTDRTLIIQSPLARSDVGPARRAPAQDQPVTRLPSDALGGQGPRRQHRCVTAGSVDDMLELHRELEPTRVLRRVTLEAEGLPAA